MDVPQKPSKSYQTHRENQRERILEVAERLFNEKGIDQVNISDIAQAARLTRHTIYEYFPNKQEIAWAIFQRMVDKNKALMMDLNQFEGSGFQRLEHLLLQLVDQVPSEDARFIVEFNTLYARESSPAHVIEMIKRASSGFETLLEEMIRQGKADGSISVEVNPHLLTAALLNLINAVISRFALLGSLIGDEYGQPAQIIYQEIFRVFLRGIQSPPPGGNARS